ncbi:RodZ domain-containing protein [Marinobacterium litorale]|uniref:RodZ domain-containing protein n=1 Tax=Marinobacterium litorale TaxID=404770 RepID=UPI000429E224|nr:RodZ domain-containing protein [Marinobacterium litorale]
MSTDTVSSDQIDSFPGGDFARARSDLGLGYEQLTRELRLQRKYLEAIEQGDLKALGGPVFARGYIRAYAKRLKLDPDRYVAVYDHVSGIRDIASAVKVVGTVSTSPAKQSRSLMRFGSFVFVLLILGTVVWWWQTQYSIDAVVAPEPDAPVTVDTADGNTLVLPPVEMPEAESVADPALNQEEIIDSTDLPMLSEPADPATDDAAAGENTEGTEAVGEVLPAEPLTEVLGQDGVSDSDGAAPEADAVVPATVPAQLHLVLSDESWLSVSDASGQSLYNGIASAGSDLTLAGDEPLSIVIGRANAVSRIAYGGEPVDIQAVSNKNVARLTLP